VTLHEFAEKGLAAAIGVEIGGIDEVAARFAEGVINFAGFVLRRAPAPVFAEITKKVCRSTFSGICCDCATKELATY
jgi:hypothetical protein